ncbi:helix-turn-helix domain-containing protein [Clostridium sp. WILCCON 0269]|uniref:Helix-turn-helix domain-containing protein n=1 Tax=Candidatus Clostridium eludens TaxID=3381663 RepID=A0ABW8SK28_9CLOT
MDIGNRIKELRLKKKWTQEQLATKAEVTRVSIGNYERNSRTPDAIALNKIAKALDVSIKALTMDKTFSEYILSSILDYFKDTPNPIEVIANNINVSSEELSSSIKNNRKNLSLEIQKKLLTYLNEIDEWVVKQIYNDVFYNSCFDVNEEIKEFIKGTVHEYHNRNLSLEDMKKLIAIESPHTEALFNFLTDPNVEMVFGYSYGTLTMKGYDELLISKVENAIKDILIEIKEKEKQGSVYIKGWHRWVSEGDEYYEWIKRIDTTYISHPE